MSRRAAVRVTAAGHRPRCPPQRIRSRVEPAGIEPATSSMPRKRAAAAPRPPRSDRDQNTSCKMRAEVVVAHPCGFPHRFGPTSDHVYRVPGQGHVAFSVMPELISKAWRSPANVSML